MIKHAEEFKQEAVRIALTSGVATWPVVSDYVVRASGSHAQCGSAPKAWFDPQRSPCGQEAAKIIACGGLSDPDSEDKVAIGALNIALGIRSGSLRNARPLGNTQGAFSYVCARSTVPAGGAAVGVRHVFALYQAIHGIDRNASGAPATKQRACVPVPICS
jgi:hypothetical protein